MFKEAYTYSDVMLVPQHSKVKSRKNVNTSVTMKHTFSHPIIPANMKSVIGKDMAFKIILSNGLAMLHRFDAIENQIALVKECMKLGFEVGNNNLCASVGVQDYDKANIGKFVEVGVRNFCIDIAHGDSESCLDMIRWIKAKFPGVFVIAGNVATGNAAERLWKAGADCVKVGVGPSGICSTRIETGNGIPQLTAIMDCYEKRKSIKGSPWGTYKDLYIIADGGIKAAGDIVKALCFADMVMIGGMFAGCEESPGEVIEVNGIKHKVYAGSSTHKTNHIEGIVTTKPVVGTFNEVLETLLEGVRSGCSYQGVDNLVDLKDNPEFVKISHAGWAESKTTDVNVIK